MKSDGQRLHEAQFAQRQAFGDVQLLPRDQKEFGHASIALDTQSLIRFAGIRAPSQAGSARAAGSVGRNGYVHAGLKMGRNTRTPLMNGGSDFMARNSRIRDHRILAAERVEVGSA